MKLTPYEILRIKRWYKTLKLSAHCLCEQSYNAERLLEIAKYIEQFSGIEANTVAKEIQETIDFHIEQEYRERAEIKTIEKEAKTKRYQEYKFQSLPVSVQQQMICESGNNYWKAVETYVKKGKKYIRTIANEIKHKESEGGDKNVFA